METEIYNNKQLEDLPNEVWVDAYGYDGMFEVSNLGRVKSLEREVNTRWGTPRLIKEKIKTQSFEAIKNNTITPLTVSLNNKTFSVSRLIFNSFNPDTCFEKNECVMHINKKIRDNRLNNLKQVTRKKSKATDMVKSLPTIKATPLNIAKAKEANKLFFNNRTHKECSKCGKIDILENFPNEVSKCQECINKYVIKRRKEYVYTGEKKECNNCKKNKLDKEFLKLDNTCKKCRNKFHNKYVLDQRENIREWYIKEYGKRNYNIKNFDKDVLEKLKNEIIEKRKPKHYLDGKEFKTTMDLARYIFKKYKIPVSTVAQRIADGRTEQECTLNRKEFVRYNLNKQE